MTGRSINALHVLLTFRCLYQCQHCFLFSNPDNKSTFTREFLRETIAEARKLPAMEKIIFEGGEPFLYYPLLLEGLKEANSSGFETGVVTNGYWANSLEDVETWLKPLGAAGLASLSISTGYFHDPEDEDSVDFSRQFILETAKKYDIKVSQLNLSEPSVDAEGELDSGGVMFKGRAAEELTSEFPRKKQSEFTSCPYEDLLQPGRVHIDPEGRVHICQGITAGRHPDTPLSRMLPDYQPEKHPILAPLIIGGPQELARQLNYQSQRQYVDACHFCFEIRKSLVQQNKYPDYLGPAAVYGLD